MFRRSMLLLASFSLLLLTGCYDDARQTRRQAPLISWHEAAGLRYLQVLPRSADPRKPLPVVLLLHGLGDRPQPAWVGPDAPPARFIVAQAPIPHGQGYSWFPYRLRDGNPNLDADIRAAADRLARLLQQLRRLHGGPERAIVSGFSQGGILSYALALLHPQVIHAAHPVAGMLPASLWPEDVPDAAPRVVGAHGDADPIIPPGPTATMVQALQTRGFPVQLQSFPQVGHSVTPKMAELADRFLSRAVAELSR